MIHAHFEQPEILEYDKIAKLPHEDVKGTWLGGGGIFRDRGYTELITSMLGGNQSNTFTNNPLVYEKAGGTPTQEQMLLGQAGPEYQTQVDTGLGLLSQANKAQQTLKTAQQQSTGGTSQLQQLSQMDRNPSQETEYQNLLRQMQGSAQSQAQAELDAAIGEFDYQKENLQAQSGQLDQQRLSALGTLDTETQRAQKEATTAKTEATSATQAAQNKALSTAQDIQKKNRNVLRALGILSSSAGGEMLTKPMTEYGSQAGQLQQGLVDRLTKVEDWWLQRSQDFTKAKTDLETQYATLKENISRDLRFNDRQRLTAVKAASAALSQRMADIQSQAMQYQQAAKQYSDNILLKIAEMKMYQNPTADVSAIYQSLLNPEQQSNTGDIAYLQKKKTNTLSGSATQ